MSGERSASAPDLSVRSYGRFVLRHRWIIGVFTVFGLAIGLTLVSRQPVEFSAVSRVVLTPEESAVSSDSEASTLQLISLDSDAQLLSSSSVLAAAASTLSWPATASSLAEGLNISAVPNSRVLIVRYDNAVARWATNGCDAIVTAFVRARATAAQVRSATARGLLEQQINDLSARLIAVQNASAALGRGAILAGRSEQIQISNQLNGLRTDLARLPTATSNSGVVVSPAHQRGEGNRPMAGATAASGSLLGLVVGLLGARLIEYRARGSRRRRSVMTARAA